MASQSKVSESGMQSKCQKLSEKFKLKAQSKHTRFSLRLHKSVVSVCPLGGV